jgi:hypothetical protein
LKKSVLGLAVSAALCSFAIGCTKSPMNPASPTAATTGGSATAAASDGSTLKVTAPATIDPTNGTVTPTRNPTLVWGNSEGKYEGVGLAYDLEVSTVDGTVVYARTVGETPNIGSHAVDLTLPYATQHWWRVRAHVDNMVGPWSGFAEFNTPKPVVAVAPPTSPTSPSGFRTPDPPGGQRLPRRNDIGTVLAYDSLHPGQLRNSCQPEGGSWAFLDGVVDSLQAIDLRYGYNCKRGNCNDPSLDVISYHWGPGNDEGSSDVYCTDLISGHCGSAPGIIWNDVTGVTLDSGTVCRVMFTRPGRKR